MERKWLVLPLRLGHTWHEKSPFRLETPMVGLVDMTANNVPSRSQACHGYSISVSTQSLYHLAAWTYLWRVVPWARQVNTSQVPSSRADSVRIAIVDQDPPTWFWHHTSFSGDESQQLCGDCEHPTLKPQAKRLVGHPPLHTDPPKTDH